MKRLIAIILILLGTATAFAQKSHICRGNSTYSSDVLYTWDGRYLYQGISTYSSDILLTIDGRIPAAVVLMIL